MVTRITQLIDFLSVLDKFKTIERKTYVSNTERHENNSFSEPFNQLWSNAKKEGYLYGDDDKVVSELI